jgi:Tol biopolymer transport system component
MNHRMEKRLVLLLAGIVAATLAETPAAAQTPGRVSRASVDSLGGEALGNSSTPSLSADGRYVAFASDAADLVPGDTNDDSDVFVRDRVTGVVDRASVAWNGNEARDDSACPSLSSDGRFVAFMSRAWNMYPGGANLGSPRWDIYLRDRQLGTTKHISVATDGSDPNGDSDCPSISGDGKRIVFGSSASNLVAGDGNGAPDVFLWKASPDKLSRVSRSAETGGDANAESSEPSISRNGRFVVFTSRATNLRETGVPQPPLVRWASTVFVRDLDAGITEAASLKDDDNTDGPYSPQEDSFHGSVSDDGRYVGFSSTAWNLIVPSPYRRSSVYVRDRETGRTILASPTGPQTDCGRPGVDFGCASSFPVPSGRISGDGRFVTFSSRSRELLPANLYHGDQVYLFDVEGGRLRRISVDRTGWESDSCSVEPVLSADSRVLAYRSTSTNLVAGDTNQRADVFVHDWTCDDSGRCRTLASCPAEPLSCAAPTSSMLRLAKRAPGGVHADRLFWRWTGDASAPAFPDPTDAGRYQLCVYGRSLELDVAAPQADACADATRPCWRSIGGGYQLIDPSGGVTSLRVKSDARGAHVQLRGKGSLVDAPYLPVVAPGGIVVQLQDAATGRCWGAAFAPGDIKRNIAGRTEPRSARDGHLVAQLP